jgi:hypothetical protein
MIAPAGAAFDFRDAAVGIQRRDDVFADISAFAAFCFDIASDFEAFNYTKRIFDHYFLFRS